MIKRIALVATLAAAGIASSAVNAGAFSLLNGRSADPSSMPPLSAEVGFVTGDFYQDIGARVNYQLSPELTVFGDLGMVEVFGGDSSLGFGGGAYYHLANQQMLPQLDMALKGSYHTAEYGFDSIFGNVSTSVSALAVEGLVSSRETIGQTQLKWYANLGLGLIGGVSSTEFLLGGGVFMPAGPGEFYAGMDLIDQITIGLGYRYFVQ